MAGGAGDPNGPVVLVDVDGDADQVGHGRGFHDPEHRRNHAYRGLAAALAGRGSGWLRLRPAAVPSDQAVMNCTR